MIDQHGVSSWKTHSVSALTQSEVVKHDFATSKLGSIQVAQHVVIEYADFCNKREIQAAPVGEW